MLYALAGLCLALILVIPLCLHLVLVQFRTLVEDTQLVQGTPARLIEQKQELVADKVERQENRRLKSMPRVGEKVGF